MHPMLRIAAVVFGAGVVVGAGCTTRAPDGAAPGGSTSASPSPAPATESDSQRIVRLEREARALASTNGCARASDCRTAPVGAKACGGPRSYITYCAATTDTVRLFATLRELERVETAYNAKTGAISNCMFRLPPTVTLVGGSCRETNGGP